MRERNCAWREGNYEARHPTVRVIRTIFERYFEAIRLGAIDGLSPDPSGILDLDAANRAIGVLIGEMETNLMGDSHHERWPQARYPAVSLVDMPDAAKLAMWQEILAAFAEHGTPAENYGSYDAYGF